MVALWVRWGARARPTSKSRLLTSLFTPDWRDRFSSWDTTTTPSRVSWQSSSRKSDRCAMELWERRSVRGAQGRGELGAEFTAGCTGSALHTSRGAWSLELGSGAPWRHAVHDRSRQPGWQVHALTSPWPPWCAPVALPILCGAAGWVPGAWPPSSPLTPCLFFRLPHPALPPCSPPPSGSASFHQLAAQPSPAAVHPGTLLPCFPASLLPDSTLPSRHHHPPFLPAPSSPARWAPRRGRKAGAQGVCSRRGRRRKKTESMT